jgi:radical SAM protein with 4Fe4S-binding SPASM domain
VYKQEPPFAVQIELTEGCNLRCPFCGLNGIRGKANDYKAMTSETLTSLIKQMVELNWNPRIEFAMHGEPTMHPDFVGMVKLVRWLAPKYSIMMTSNGGGLLKKPGPVELIKQLFDAGLNCLALDDYQHANIVPKIRKEIGYAGEIAGWLNRVSIDAVYEYPANKKGNPHGRHHRRSLVFIQAIDTASTGTHSHLNNHAGAGAPPNDTAQGKRCAKPFRELSVRWDGNVAVCCNDWRGIYKCGNVVKDGLDKVWNGAAMDAARRHLVRGEREAIEPCRGCDAKSDRVGLLPDKFGKDEMPKPNTASRKAAAAAVAGDSYTDAVLRPWEK